MSFLKNILGAFVELKGDTPGETKENSSVKNNNDNVSPPANTRPDKHASLGADNQDTPGGTTSSSPGFQQHFEDLIDEANANNPMFQGTDFKEFIESKSDVEAIADEPTKYRTAFNVLKRTGLTKARLVTTGEEYIKIIEQDLREFQTAFDQQYKADVEHKEQLLQQKAQELQALNEKISFLNDEIKKMSQEIIQSKDKLNVNKNAFVSAGEGKKKEIRTELQKIKEYFL